MPRYVAFLRAINLGARRKFPRADIVAATTAAGMTDVQTHINTGNVLLTSPLRSRATVRSALEEAYAADRGFEVPAVVVAGRAAYTLTPSVPGSRLIASKEYAALGEGTSRTISVLAAIAEKWC